MAAGSRIRAILAILNTGSYRYNLDPADFPRLDDLPGDHPTRVGYRTMAVG